MKNSLWVLLIISSCQFNCIDQKPGNPRHSLNLGHSVFNRLYKYKLKLLGDGTIRYNGRENKVVRAWVERNWTYECVGSHTEIKKEKGFQVIIQFEKDWHATGLYLGKKKGSGTGLNEVISVDYNEYYVLNYYLQKDRQILDSLQFILVD